MRVFPDYHRSVYNIPSTIMGMLTTPNPLMLKDFKDLHVDRLIFILIDALGYELFEKYLEKDIDARCTKITSLFPSTTAAVLTTLYTGLSPKEHGILEWYMYYEEYGGIIKTLPFSPMDIEENDALIGLGVSPEPLFMLPTIFEKLKNQGVESSSYIREEYAHSSYSEHMFKGSHIVPYSSLSEAFNRIMKDTSNFIQIYIDYVDTAEHLYGPYSKEVEKEIERIFREIEKIKGSATVIVAADHGQMEIKEKRILKGHRALVGGSPRDMFIYGDTNMGCDFEVLRKDEFMKLLGPGNEHPRLEKRVPEMVILPEEFTGVWFRDFYAKGLHGGMSPQEMYVPFIVFEGKI